MALPNTPRAARYAASRSQEPRTSGDGGVYTMTPSGLRYSLPSAVSARRHETNTVLNPKFTDHAFRVLQNAPISEDQRADLWDRFHSSKNANDLGEHLKDLPLPASLKMNLILAKQKPAVEPTDMDKAKAVLQHIATMDPKVLEAAEQHPNVLKTMLAAVNGGSK